MTCLISACRDTNVTPTIEIFGFGSNKNFLNGRTSLHQNSSELPTFGNTYKSFVVSTIMEEEDLLQALKEVEAMATAEVNLDDLSSVEDKMSCEDESSDSEF